LTALAFAAAAFLSVAATATFGHFLNGNGCHSIWPLGSNGNCRNGGHFSPTIITQTSGLYGDSADVCPIPENRPVFIKASRSGLWSRSTPGGAYINNPVPIHCDSSVSLYTCTFAEYSAISICSASSRHSIQRDSGITATLVILPRIACIVSKSFFVHGRCDVVSRSAIILDCWPLLIPWSNTNNNIVSIALTTTPTNTKTSPSHSRKPFSSGDSNIIPIATANSAAIAPLSNAIWVGEEGRAPETNALKKCL
jgi:hypothetical protein